MAARRRQHRNLAGSGNVIAFNGGSGVTVGQNASDPIDDNTISGNSIFSNRRLGIDLGNDGVTPNTPGGPHTGPNHLQNYPILSSVDYFDGVPAITGTLNSTPDTAFTIEFFASAASTTPRALARARAYLGSDDLCWTDRQFRKSASFSAIVAAEPSGELVLTATTATDPGNSTSEFSSSQALVPPTPSLLVTNTNDSGPGSLRQAIVTLDATGGGDTISFDIPGAGVHTIAPATDLPPITRPGPASSTATRSPGRAPTH